MPDDDALRPIQNAKDTVERAAGTVLNWLPSAKRCEDCGVRCEDEWEYDAQQAAFNSETYGQIPVYTCPECGKSWRRERREGLSFNIWE